MSKAHKPSNDDALFMYCVLICLLSVKFPFRL